MVRAELSEKRQLREHKTWAFPERHDILERSSRMEGKGCTASILSSQPCIISDDGGYITIREVARRSSMSEKSIRNFIRNDALPHYRNSKSGKIWLRWIEFVEWMERRRIELKRDDNLLCILRHMSKAKVR